MIFVRIVNLRARNLVLPLSRFFSHFIELLLIEFQIPVIRGTTLALQYMDNTKGGHGGNIINIGSLAGLNHYVKRI